MKTKATTCRQQNRPKQDGQARQSQTNAEESVHGSGNGPSKDTRWYPHVTVACIAKRNGKYLMVKERYRGGSVINQPAGHVEPGESLIEAVIRETLEETGWQFAPNYLSGIYQFVANNGETYMRFAFSGELIALNKNHSLDPVVEEVLWLERAMLENNLEHLRSQAVLKCIADFENGNRLPLNCVQQLESA